MEYEPVIGLEVHAQLNTKTKIFCSCSTKFGAPPNTHICPVCTGQPGVLPVLNKKVVEYAIKMGLATNCTIARVSRFARKNYFYPDLPKGYQISQYELPLAEHGFVEILVDGEQRRIGLTRIHMEEDAGKLVHPGSFTDTPYSLVDYNRSSVPLIEIVSEPDMRSPKEAGAYLRNLRAVLRYLEISDGNMEEGSFRCDANISVRPKGREKLGTRSELKNMNSFRNVEKALDYEIERQISILEDGGTVVQETRLWDTANGVTRTMRSKEEADDYRYFPDPDLLPLVVENDWIEEIRATMPELPGEKRDRLVAQYGIPPYDAEVITSEKTIADYFEACAAACNAPKPASNWIMGEVLRELKERQIEISQFSITAENLARMIQMIEKGTISGKIAKTVFADMAETGDSPEKIVQDKNLAQVSDQSAIESVVLEIIQANPDQVKKYRGGKAKLLGFFVGQVMQKTRGKANPQMVNQILKKNLDG